MLLSCLGVASIAINDAGKHRERGDGNGIICFQKILRDPCVCVSICSVRNLISKKKKKRKKERKKMWLLDEGERTRAKSPNLNIKIDKSKWDFDNTERCQRENNEPTECATVNVSMAPLIDTKSSIPFIVSYFFFGRLPFLVANCTLIYDLDNLFTFVKIIHWPECGTSKNELARQPIGATAAAAAHCTWICIVCCCHYARDSWLFFGLLFLGCDLPSLKMCLFFFFLLSFEIW